MFAMLARKCNNDSEQKSCFGEKEEEEEEQE